MVWPAVELAGAPVLEQRTRPGQRLALSLDDGSVLDLAGDTWVRVRQTPHRRQVELLRGEAFFDVAHAAGRPFEVLTADSRVRVGVEQTNEEWVAASQAARLLQIAP